MGAGSAHLAAPSNIKRLTLLCLAGLAGGVAAGILAAALEPPGTSAALGTAEAIIRAWTNAFRVLVAPLVVAQLYLALAGGEARASSAGRLGVSIPFVFGGLLALTAAATLLLTSGILTLPWFADLSLAAGAPPPDPASGAGTTGTWVDDLVPPNLIATAATDNILPLMVFTLAFALAMRRAEPEVGATMTRLFEGVSHACFTLVGWLLRLTPIVMLGLGFRAAIDSGATVGGVLLIYAGTETVVLVGALLLLYPVAILVAGVHPGRFVRSLAPAQLTAFATRSSLATLPALLKGAEKPLGLRPEVSAAVLPVAGATLKLSRAVSGPARLLFLAHVLNISIGVQGFVVFAATIMLLSTSTVGVPSVMSGNRSLPAYVAAGIPAEYVILMSVVVSLTDVFRTVLNTSGYMTAAALVNRFGVRTVAGTGGTSPSEATPPLPASAT